MMETHQLERKEPLNPVRLEKMFLYKFPMLFVCWQTCFLQDLYEQNMQQQQKTNGNWWVDISIPYRSTRHKDDYYNIYYTYITHLFPLAIGDVKKCQSSPLRKKQPPGCTLLQPTLGGFSDPRSQETPTDRGALKGAGSVVWMDWWVSVILLMVQEIPNNHLGWC